MCISVEGFAAMRNTMRCRRERQRERRCESKQCDVGDDNGSLEGRCRVQPAGHPKGGPKHHRSERRVSSERAERRRRRTRLFGLPRRARFVHRELRGWSTELLRRCRPARCCNTVYVFVGSMNPAVLGTQWVPFWAGVAAAPVGRIACNGFMQPIHGASFPEV